MKKYLLLLASLALFALPALALDPHDAQTVTVTALNTLTTTAPQTIAITSLTTHAVNSGTNSYFIWAKVKYDCPLGDQVTLQLMNDAAVISGATQIVSGQGTAILMTEVESIAVSHVIAVKAVVTNTAVQVNFPAATLVINGQAGATQ